MIRNQPPPLKPCPPHLQKYVDYMNNVGDFELQAHHFDDDHAPIGPMVRKDLQSLGLIYEITEDDMKPPKDNRPRFQPRRTGIFLLSLIHI